MSVLKSRVAVTILSCAMLAASALPAQATTVTDEYLGADDHGYGDVIGSESIFDIISADITRTGTTLNVSINTNFAGEGDNVHFSNLTYDSEGIGYGDLFLASSWLPSGTAPYAGDDHSTGTVWSYGFAVDDRWMTEGVGTGTLYSLDSGVNDTDAWLSENFVSAGTWRDGQEVAVDTTVSSVTALAGNSSWSVDSDSVDFSIDLIGTSLENSDTIAFHWAMTCANDTIEGEVSVVPLPGALLMMLSGLGVFGAVGLRRSKRN